VSAATPLANLARDLHVCVNDVCVNDVCEIDMHHGNQTRESTVSEWILRDVPFRDGRCALV
jgi:hypothetical protein